RPARRLALDMICRLELVGQTQCNDVVGCNTDSIGEGAVVQQVDFVINVGRHVFVEVVGCAHFNVLNQILVAVRTDVFTFGLQVRNGRTQTEVELVLSNRFKVLGFVRNIAVTEAGHVASFRIGGCQVQVVCV